MVDPHHKQLDEIMDEGKALKMDVGKESSCGICTEY